MGIYGGIDNVSSDSIPIYFVAMAANCVLYLRTLLLRFLQSLGFLHFNSQMHDFGRENLGLGLAKIVILAEELQKTPSFLYGLCRERDCGEEEDCMVCLCKMTEGEEVRKLGCGHVFHRSCLDGWLRLLKLNCPLCRAPLVEEERFTTKETQISRELLYWFS